MVLGLLRLWLVLNALDLNRVAVTVDHQPNLSIPPLAPASTDDQVREIVLGILEVEGTGFQSSAYAESRGIAIKAGGDVTVYAYGSRKEETTYDANSHYTDNTPNTGANVNMNYSSPTNADR